MIRSVPNIVDKRCPTGMRVWTTREWILLVTAYATTHSLHVTLKRCRNTSTSLGQRGLAYAVKSWHWKRDRWKYAYCARLGGRCKRMEHLRRISYSAHEKRSHFTGLSVPHPDCRTGLPRELGGLSMSGGGVEGRVSWTCYESAEIKVVPLELWGGGAQPLPLMRVVNESCSRIKKKKKLIGGAV